jgi:hypothetical protein
MLDRASSMFGHEYIRRRSQKARPPPDTSAIRDLPCRFICTQELDSMNTIAARPCLDVLMLASRLALEHQEGLEALMKDLVRGEGCREKGESLVAVGSLRALAEALQGLLGSVGQEGGGGACGPGNTTEAVTGQKRKVRSGRMS